MTSRAVSLSVVLLAVAGTASAQSIPIQTVPLVPADQFDIFPSLTLAMGGVSIAVPDTLHDPFVNPAKGARLRTARFFSAPTFYSVSHDAGAGRTLPLGVFSTAGTWYGGLALALQQVDASHPSSPSLNFPGAFDTTFRLAAPLPSGVPDLSTGSESHGNALAFALIGKELPGSGLSVAGSIAWAKLRALDGVDLLYPGSRRVDQSGETFDARLGVLKEWAGDRSFEAIVLHERFRMTHEVLPRRVLGSGHPAVLPEFPPRAQSRFLQAVGCAGQIRASAGGLGMAHRLARDLQSHLAAQHAEQRRLEHPAGSGARDRVRARRRRFARLWAVGVRHGRRVPADLEHYLGRGPDAGRHGRWWYDPGGGQDGRKRLSLLERADPHRRESRGHARAPHPGRRPAAGPRRALRPLQPRAARPCRRGHAASGRIVARMDADVGPELPLPGARAAIPRARVARDGSAGRIEPEWVHRQSRGRWGAGLLSPRGLGGY